MVIIIYSKEEVKALKKESQTDIKNICPKVNDACPEKTLESLSETKTSENTNKNQTININTATEEEMQNLDGIGENKAKAIVKYRNENGNFKTIEDIKKVSGIGSSAFEKIKDNITV